MTTRSRRLTLLAITATTALAAPPAAGAGTATVYQCTGPGGQALSTDMLTPPTPPAATLYARCGSALHPWGLVIEKHGVVGTPSLAPGDYGEARVSAPAGTLITGGTLTRQMLGYRQVSKVTDGFGYWLRTAEGATIENCGGSGTPPPDGCWPQADGLTRFANTVRDVGVTRGPPVAAVVTSALRVAVGCFIGPGRCHASTGQEGLGIAQMALRITETEAPVVRSAAGSLVTDTPVRSRELAINASDTGLGLFRVLVYVDGTLAETQPFDASRPACADVDPATPYPYELPGGYTCPTGSTSRSFSLAALPADGQHEIRVLVEDAAGNATVALQRTATLDLPVNGLRCPTNSCVTPRPVPNGTNATADATLKATTKGRTRRSLDHGQRAMIAGTVTTPAGAPVTNAVIDVHSLIDTPGAAWQPAGSARTDAQGRFRYAIPKGPTRTFRLAYHTHLGDPQPARTADVRIAVRAGVTASARPQHVSPGRRVRVRGRLRGPGIPASGVNVELQALDGREWRTFKTLTVRRGGRFSYRYRFRHTTRNARFLWRIHVRKQAALPYAAASSRSFWVIVRP